MKVAYLIESAHAREILEYMIIPQIEEERHGATVAGMMFFFDNTYMLVDDGSGISKRLAAIADKTGMILMGCDRCCYQREIADKLVDPAGIGCFPDVYAVLGSTGVDQVITL